MPNFGLDCNKKNLVFLISCEDKLWENTCVVPTFTLTKGLNSKRRSLNFFAVTDLSSWPCGRSLNFTLGFNFLPSLRSVM